LSPREREVLALVAEGLTNREIGERLGMTRGTARNHVAQICVKLGAETRTAAAVYALRAGLLEGQKETPPGTA
jgi:DNA-binding NarL/FixJ family response regulator